MGDFFHSLLPYCSCCTPALRGAGCGKVEYGNTSNDEQKGYKNKEGERTDALSSGILSRGIGLLFFSVLAEQIFQVDGHQFPLVMVILVCLEPTPAMRMALSKS